MEGPWGLLPKLEGWTDRTSSGARIFRIVMARFRTAHHSFLPALLSMALLPLGATATATAQCGQSGDCLVPHPTPGCENQQCCEEVCVQNPFCCDTTWDTACADLAGSVCEGLCGATASGSCFTIHVSPGCDRRECCEAVCAVDPACCEEDWDSKCVAAAEATCRPPEPVACGDPDAGSCIQPHPTPSCSDAECCEFICTLDPGCCEFAWDDLCATLAVALCAGSCETDCPPGAVAEDEDCGQDRNNPCVAPVSPFPSVQSLACGTWACGRITSVPGGFRDVDVWNVSVTDSDGDGQVPVRLEFSSSFNGFAALVPAGCGPLADATVFVGSNYCVDLQSVVTCVPAGSYRIVVAAGDFPVPANPAQPCGTFGLTPYRVRLECLATGCGPVCGPGGGSCFEPSKQSGCDDPECCDVVCVVDPACCSTQWDPECVQHAQQLCADPPANDDCAAATVLEGDSAEVVIIAATTSQPPFPATCGASGTVTDVWFRSVAPATAACIVTTCGSVGFNPIVAVYGSCGGTPLACNNDSLNCIPKTASRVSFPATCGSEYLIRVGSIGGQPGSVTLLVTYDDGPGCSCPADLDGNGTVGGSDLTTVLSAWGGPNGDLDGDGTTDAADLTELLSAWGPCP